MRQLLSSISAALLSVGCAQPPQSSGTVIPPAPRGVVPTEAEATAALLAHLERTLRDPDSVKQFRVLTPPAWAVWTGTGQWARSLDGGWMICYELNAKNSYGGYAGLQKRAIAFESNQGRLIPITDVNMSTVDPACPA